MHITLEAINDDAAEASMDVVRAICLKRGREIPNLLPMAMAANRFFVRGFLVKKASAGCRPTPWYRFPPPSKQQPPCKSSSTRTATK